MLKKFFKKKSLKKGGVSKADTRKVSETCNFWADEDKVNYSSMNTAQDVLEEDDEKKETKINVSGGIGGCGGGCLGGGCGGGCF